MTAMILAAGLGTRMRPLTNHTPKPLIKIGGKPLILWHIERLKKFGFLKIVVNVAYLGEQIKRYLGDGSKFGVDIIISDEQHEGALETAGGVVKALPLLSETFLVVNGDIWTDYAFDKSFKLKDENVAKLILVKNPEHHLAGDFFLSGTEERYTFSGIGYYSKKMFQNVEYGKESLVPLLYNAIDNNLLATELHKGAWYDIGTPKRLYELEQIICNKKENKSI